MSTTLGDLAVLIGAEVKEAGFNRAVAAIGGIETAANAAAAGASSAMGQIGAATDKSAQRITDAGGRIRDGYGKFVSAGQLAAEAAANAGGSLGNLSDVASRASTSINSGLVSSFAAFDKAVKPLNDGIGRLGEGLKSAGGNLTTYVTLPLAGLATGAVLAAAKVDSLTRGLQAVTQQQLGEQGITGLQGIAQAATDTQARLKELREVAKLPGLGFTEAIQGDIRLRAVGLSADLSKRALLAFGNAIATTGGGKSELDRVTVQLGQLSAKGKVLAQDLRPIIEAAPAVATALKNLYGTVDSETISKSLEKQGKSSTDFINVLTDELAKLPKVTGGLAIAGENISDSLTLAGSKIGLTAEKLFDLSGIANRAGEFIEGLADKFAALDPGTQKLIFGLGAAAAAAGPIIFGLGAVAAAIPSVVAGFEVLGLASTAALGPIGIGVAAVAAAAILIIEHWGELTDYFGSDGEGGRVFSDLAESVGNSISQISAAFSALNGGGDFSDLVSATGILKAAFRDVAVGITAVSNVIGGTIGAIVKLLSGDLPGAADEALRAFEGLVQPLANVLGFQLRLNEASEGVRKGFEGAALGGGVFGDSLLHVSGLLSGFNTQLAGFAGGLPNYGKPVEQFGGLLQRLEERLKGLKEQQEAANTEAATLSFNPAIKSLEAYIARLRGASASTKQAQKDIKGLKEDLLGLRIADIVKPLYETPEFKLKGLLPDIKSDPLNVKLKPIDAKPITEPLNEATERMARFQKTAEDFTAGIGDVLSGGFSTIASDFGAAIGDIISGAAGLDALPAVILSGIGDLAIRVGQLAIGVGIAVSGIKAALETLNPVVAIAGGIALVALGTAVKGAASSIAGGGGSSLASQPRTSYNNSSQINQQPFKIQVVGELKGRGADLVAVLRGTDYRELRTR